MKWLLMALLIAVSPVVANAGTFSDNFNDGQLDGWHIWKRLPRIPIMVEIQNGYVVMDTREKLGENPRLWHLKTAELELRAGNAKNWNAYTFTARVRIAEALDERPSIFSIDVRRGDGRFDLAAQQTMLILPFNQLVSVSTTPPHAKVNPEKIKVEGHIHRGNFKVPIKRRWYPIKIVADAANFAFYFDNHLVVQYEDKTAVPGTVGFQANFGLLVHLDDVVITGPQVPDLANSVNPKGHLTTTWGKIKTNSTELQRQ